MKRAAVVVSAVLLLAACGGGGGGTSAKDQIKAAYLGFFSPTGSFADHAALLEDGTKPSSPIQATHFVGRPDSVSVTVSKVTLQGAAKAEVTFTIHYSIFNFVDRTGYAVLQDGKWKVASKTLCPLVAIWNGIPWHACSA